MNKALAHFLDVLDSRGAGRYPTVRAYGTQRCELEELMKQSGKTYDPVTYEGAGHGFMRAGEAPDAGDANRRAREQAWERLKKLLQAI